MLSPEIKGFAFLTAAAIALGAVSGLALSYGPQLESDASKQAKARAARVESVLSEVRAQLRNPESAQFRNVKITSDGVVCGEVNGNNAFGALAGFDYFVRTQSGGLYMLHPDSQYGRATYRANCL